MDRNAVGQFENWLGPFPRFEHIARHDEADGALGGGLQDEGIGIRSMVTE